MKFTTFLTLERAEIGQFSGEIGQFSESKRSFWFLLLSLHFGSYRLISYRLVDNLFIIIESSNPHFLCFLH